MMSAEIRQLANEIHQQRIRDARRMSPIDKLLAGPRLFERACWWMAVGLRNRFPDADESEIQGLIRDRLTLKRQRESLP